MSARPAASLAHAMSCIACVRVPDRAAPRAGREGGGEGRGDACWAVARDLKREDAGERFQAPFTKWPVFASAPGSQRARRSTERSCDVYCFRLAEFLQSKTSMSSATSWGGQGSTLVSLRATREMPAEGRGRAYEACTPNPNTPRRTHIAWRFFATGTAQSTQRSS
jgi:hypothetical protein